MTVALDKAPMRELVKVPSVQGRINELLGKRAPQFCSTLIQMSNQPHLKGCTSTSLLGAAMTAASLDLPINQNLGFAHMVPYSNNKKIDGKWVKLKECQLQIGYKGFIQLAQRTGQYRAMNDAVIPSGCLVSYNELTGELVVDFSKDSGDGLKKPDGYAFYFELLNGFKKTVFWSHDKMIKHAERYSRSFRDGKGPWIDNEDGMGAKTVIKLTLGKYGMLSVDMQKALETDQSVIDGTCDVAVDVDYIDNLEGASEVSEDPAGDTPPPPFDRKKAVNTLNVLLKHREDEFKSACGELDIPFDMWADAPDALLQELCSKING